MKGRWWLWCISLAPVTGAGALLWFGVRPWTIAFALLILVCLAVIAWGVAYAQRYRRDTRAQDESWSASVRRKLTGAK